MDTITLKVSDGTEMQAYASRPAPAAGLPQGSAPKKGIIVIQEVFGVTDYIKSMAERFVPQGYLAIAPEMFHRSAPLGWTADYTDYPSVAPHAQALTFENQAADMKACFDWLVAQGVPENKIVVLGFCLGGSASFLANATLPLAAAVSFYGGSIADKMLDRINDLHAPQLLMWGGKDSHIPPEKTRAVADALTKAGKAFIDVTFSEADHAFTRTVDPSHYHEASAKEAWALTDAFLANLL